MTRALPLIACFATACAPAWQTSAADELERPDIVFEEVPSPEGVPDAVDDFLPPADFAALEAIGLTIHRGEDPPFVEGLYLMDTLTVTFDEVDAAVGTVVMPVTTGFTNQRPDGALDSTQDDDISDATGSGAFLSGTGDCFSAYIDFRGFVESDDCHYSMPQILSGCLGDEGIEDLVIGYVMAETNGACNMTVPRGHRRILEEDDGLAERLLAS